MGQGRVETKAIGRGPYFLQWLQERLRWRRTIERTSLAGTAVLPAKGFAALALRVPGVCGESERGVCLLGSPAGATAFLLAAEACWLAVRRAQ
jgi:hypothetical protein